MRAAYAMQGQASALCSCGDNVVVARLNQAALTHCKGSALAVAVNVTDECHVRDAHGGLASDLQSYCPSSACTFHSILSVSGFEWHHTNEGYDNRRESTAACTGIVPKRGARMRSLTSIAPPVAPVLLVKVEESRRTYAH